MCHLKGRVREIGSTNQTAKDRYIYGRITDIRATRKIVIKKRIECV